MQHSKARGGMMVVTMIGRAARKLALCASSASLLYVVSFAQVAAKMQGDRSTSGQFFFGTSQEVKRCPNAWLLYLDKEHHNGGVFVVTGMEKFSKLELGRDDALLFQWSGLGDRNYRFSGTLKANELSGEVQLVDVGSNTANHLCDIAARELAPQTARSTPEHQVLAARYSNEAYASEGGDPTGVDIRFFSTGNGFEGMITFYEGYWDEPIDTPLALSLIEVGKGTIQFAAETPRGLIHYHLRLTAAGALFNRDDKAQEGEKDIPLKKGRTPLPAVGW